MTRPRNMAIMLPVLVVGAAFIVTGVIALAVSRHGEGSPTPDATKDWTPVRVITRDTDMGGPIFARPVPGGCLYVSANRMAMQLSQAPCPADAARD